MSVKNMIQQIDRPTQVRLHEHIITYKSCSGTNDAGLGIFSIVISLKTQKCYHNVNKNSHQTIKCFSAKSKSRCTKLCV